MNFDPKCCHDASQSPGREVIKTIQHQGPHSAVTVSSLGSSRPTAAGTSCYLAYHILSTAMQQPQVWCNDASPQQEPHRLHVLRFQFFQAYNSYMYCMLIFNNILMKYTNEIQYIYCMYIIVYHIMYVLPVYCIHMSLCKCLL